jgi:hypothetical protein
MNAAIAAIVIAQILVMATIHSVRKSGKWQSRGKAGFAVFCLEVVYVSISLAVANLI